MSASMDVCVEDGIVRGGGGESEEQVDPSHNYLCVCVCVCGMRQRATLQPTTLHHTPYNLHPHTSAPWRRIDRIDTTHVGKCCCWYPAICLRKVFKSTDQ